MVLVVPVVGFIQKDSRVVMLSEAGREMLGVTRTVVALSTTVGGEELFLLLITADEEEGAVTVEAGTIETAAVLVGVVVSFTATVVTFTAGLEQGVDSAVTGNFLAPSKGTFLTLVEDDSTAAAGGGGFGAAIGIVVDASGVF